MFMANYTTLIYISSLVWPDFKIVSEVFNVDQMICTLQVSHLLTYILFHLLFCYNVVLELSILKIAI